MTVVMPRVRYWTCLAVGLSALFLAVLWLRWGSFEPSRAREQQITRPSNRARDPLAPPESEAFRCTRVAVWRIGRLVILSTTFAVGTAGCALAAAAVGFGVAVWAFEHGHVVLGSIWPILADVHGVSWIIVPIAVPIVLLVAISAETLHWLFLHECERTREQQANDCIQPYLPYLPHRLLLDVTAPAPFSAFVDDASERFSPRTAACLNGVLLVWAVASATLLASDTIMINEIGVMLAVSALATAWFVGSLIRPQLSAALNGARRVL
jgi:hypothetical protein